MLTYQIPKAKLKNFDKNSSKKQNLKMLVRFMKCPQKYLAFPSFDGVCLQIQPYLDPSYTRPLSLSLSAMLGYSQSSIKRVAVVSSLCWLNSNISSYL